MKMQRNIKNLLILLFVVILIADLAASLPCKGKKKPPKPKFPVPTLPAPGPVEPPTPSGFPVVPTGSPVEPPAPSGSPKPPITPGPAKPPKSDGNVHAGDGTFFTPNLGACGAVGSSESAIVALAAPDFDPSTPDGNPNHNTLCGRKIRIFRNGKSADATIEDRCPECKAGDVDMSPAVFNQLAEPVEGRVPVTWQFID